MLKFIHITFSRILQYGELVYYTLLRRPELDDIFVKYATEGSGVSSDGCHMTPSDLSTFMQREQRIEMSVEECERFIRAYEPTADRERTSLSMEGFTQFMMFSEWQEIVNLRYKANISGGAAT